MRHVSSRKQQAEKWEQLINMHKCAPHAQQVQCIYAEMTASGVPTIPRSSMHFNPEHVKIMARPDAGRTCSRSARTSFEGGPGLVPMASSCLRASAASRAGRGWASYRACKMASCDACSMSTSVGIDHADARE
jgi:hypothetical protein